MTFHVGLTGNNATKLNLGAGTLVPISEAPQYVHMRLTATPDLTGQPAYYWDEGDTRHIQDLFFSSINLMAEGHEAGATGLGLLLDACMKLGVVLRLWSSENNFEPAYGMFRYGDGIKIIRDISEISPIVRYYSEKIGAVPLEFVFFPDSVVAATPNDAAPWLPLIQEFDSVAYGWWEAYIPPTPMSIEHINKSLGIALPPSLLAFACYSRYFSDVFLSLGHDYDGDRHILQKNDYIRNGKDWRELGTPPPEHLILITENFMSEDFWCLDISEPGPEYPVVFWNPGLDPAEYPEPHANLAAFMTSVIGWQKAKKSRKERRVLNTKGTPS